MFYTSNDFGSIYSSPGFSTEFKEYEYLLLRAGRTNDEKYVALGTHGEFPSGKQLYQLLKGLKEDYPLASAERYIWKQYEIIKQYAGNLVLELGAGTGDKNRDDFREILQSASEGISPSVQLLLKGPTLVFFNDRDVASLTIGRGEMEETTYPSKKIIEVPTDFLDPTFLDQRINLRDIDNSDYSTGRVRRIVRTAKSSLSIREMFKKNKGSLRVIMRGGTLMNHTLSQMQNVFHLCHSFPRGTISYLMGDHTDDHHVLRRMYGNPIMKQIVLSGYYFCKRYHPDLVKPFDDSAAISGLSVEDGGKNVKDQVVIVDSPHGPLVWIALSDDDSVNFWGSINKVSVEPVRKMVETAGYRHSSEAGPGESSYRLLTAPKDKFGGLNGVCWELTNA